MVDPSWAAIDSALRRLYPKATPRHHPGVAVFPRGDHWHFISYGVAKTGSGRQCELTFRLARPPDEVDPPQWAIRFLRHVAEYAVSSSNPLAAGHLLNLNGPIALAEPDTVIRAAVFTEDPELDLPFLQIVGLALDEYSAMQRWKVKPILALLRERSSLLVTTLDRASIIDPTLAAKIDKRAAEQGSTTASLFVTQLSWWAENASTAGGPARAVIAVGASAAERIGRGLIGRIPHRRDLTVRGPEHAVRFRPGDHASAQPLGDGGGDLEIRLPVDALAELVELLQPRAGIYPLRSMPGLTLHIVKSTIRDSAGNVVGEVG